MTTRNYKSNGIFNNSEDSEYSIPDDFEIPNCTIEDVDRALFNLFDKQLPFSYTRKGVAHRCPVIFASGERFAVLRRKRPLRDKSGTLILPLVSIMRTGINQTPTMGAGTNQNAEIVLSKKLSSKDPDYQKILNKAGLKNSDDHSVSVKPTKQISDSSPTPGENPIPGRIQSSEDSGRLTTGPTLNPELNNNIFEFITMPAPKYYTATYDITFWTQYTKQMNDLIMSLMSMYQSYSQRTFKIETDKGYWFVAYAGDSLSPGNNFEDFSDSERLVRYSFEVTVPAYIVGNVVPGDQSSFRRTYSAPIIQFGIETVSKDIPKTAPAGIQSGKPEDYVLEDIRSISEPLPGQAVARAKSKAAVDTRGPNRDKSSQVESVGEKDSKE